MGQFRRAVFNALDAVCCSPTPSHSVVLRRRVARTFPSLSARPFSRHAATGVTCASFAAAAFCTSASGDVKKSLCDEALPSTTRMTVVLFGDSITGWAFGSGGWGQRLGEYYNGRADVLNRGYPGYNTRFGLLAAGRLLRVKDAKDARERSMNEHLAAATIWTVMLGTNDSGLPNGGFAVVHVPLEEYERRLTSIVRTIQSVTTARTGQPAKVLVMTPSVVDEHRVGPDAGAPSHTNANTGLYAEAARRVASRCDAVLVDVYSAMQAEENLADFLSDGLHLNEKGNELVFNLVKAAIEERLAELNPAVLPREMPIVSDLWGDQDYVNVFAKY